MTRPVAIVASSITLAQADAGRTTDEMAFAVAKEAVTRSGIPRRAIALTVSASSDMLEGRPFNLVKGLEALGAHPAIHYRHVEMDGAWAAYEAWVAMQAGEFDAALVVAWSKTSEASLDHVTNTQLDPFVLAPLGMDRETTAALQAEAWAARTGSTWEEPFAAPTADGACAIVLSTDPPGDHPVWIRGADHRTETGAIGHRDLSRATSARSAFERARAMAGWDGAGWDGIDAAEVHASFAHQPAMLSEAFGLTDASMIDADPIMATGLIRLAEGARRCTMHPGARVLAHATSGHALQQNAVFLLEAGA